MKIFDPEAYPYTPHFCEENIWKLAQALITQGCDPETLQVLFLSNRKRQVALAWQKMSPPGRLLVWDYHVILQAVMNEELYVFDFETRLGFPCQAEWYFRKTLPEVLVLLRDLRPSVRIIPAATYLEQFCSDRSHMLGEVEPEDFPSWPPICPAEKGRRIMLAEYRDMDRELNDGSIVICREQA
jgi:protein N-terminal glutamine amidohydrolase